MRHYNGELRVPKKPPRAPKDPQTQPWMTPDELNIRLDPQLADPR